MPIRERVVPARSILIDCREGLDRFLREHLGLHVNAEGYVANGGTGFFARSLTLAAQPHFGDTPELVMSLEFFDQAQLEYLKPTIQEFVEGFERRRRVIVVCYLDLVVG